MPPILSNVFGGDDNSSSSSNSNDGSASGDLTNDLMATVGLDAQSSNESYSQDEDGNTEYSSSDNSIGTDIDTSDLLGATGDSEGSSMSDSDSYSE